MDEQKKQCTTCKEWYPATTEHFYKSTNGGTFGLRSKCKKCTAELRKARRWANPSKRHEEDRRYYHLHKERIAARRSGEHHRWLARNRNVQFRAKPFGGKGVVSRQEWEDIKQKFDYRCVRCGKREPEIALEWDHIKPIRRGGQHSIDNIQPLCRSCNAKKGRKEIDYRH